IRAGKNKGMPIEGKGVVSDALVPLTVADIGAEAKGLVAQIRTKINQLQPHYQASMQVRRGGFVFLQNNAPASWSEQVRGIDRLEVATGGQLLSAMSVTPSQEYAELVIDLPMVREAWEDRAFALTGFSGNRQVFRVVRTVAWRGEYYPIPAEGIALNFDAGVQEPLKLPLPRQGG